MGSGRSDNRQTEMLALHTRSRLSLLRDSLLDVLAGLDCVKSVGLFGSLASDSWDEWSDVDLFVSCEETNTGGPRIVDEINGRLPITCHRPFAANSSPDGRYWFRGYSPFHKLDISFHNPGDWSAILDKHSQEGSPVALTDCHGSSQFHTRAAFRWEFSPKQGLLFDTVHRIEKYARSYARSGSDLTRLSSELTNMKQYMEENPPSNPFETRAWTVANDIALLVHMILPTTAE